MSMTRCRSICSISSLSTRNRGRSAVSQSVGEVGQPLAVGRDHLPPDRCGHLLEPRVRGVPGEQISSTAYFSRRILQQPHRLAQRFPDVIPPDPCGIHGLPKWTSLMIKCRRDDRRERFPNRGKVIDQALGGRQLSRQRLLELLNFVEIPPCLIPIDGCPGDQLLAMRNVFWLPIGFKRAFLGLVLLERPLQLPLPSSRIGHTAVQGIRAPRGTRRGLRPRGRVTTIRHSEKPQMPDRGLQNRSFLRPHVFRTQPCSSGRPRRTSPCRPRPARRRPPQFGKQRARTTSASSGTGIVSSTEPPPITSPSSSRHRFAVRR